jgi:hypothetical protein
MKLFCWILDKSGSPFPVDIEESGSVGDLKKAMVKENPQMFGNVDAPQLRLWKVSGSFTFDVHPPDPSGQLIEAEPADSNDRFREDLLSHRKDLSMIAKELNALRKLSNVLFKDEEEHLHVIVERPGTGEYESHHMNLF